MEHPLFVRCSKVSLLFLTIQTLIHSALVIPARILVRDY
jgi:hypothetical protein